MELPQIQKEMVEKFQCPGCVCGMDVTCGKFESEDDEGPGSNYSCKGHVAGTMIAGVGSFYLGLPKGFCRVGVLDRRWPPSEKERNQNNNIRLFDKMPQYNKLNVPVWVMEKDDHLFVRCFMPRINYTTVDVIKGGKIADLPAEVAGLAINVAEFIGRLTDEENESTSVSRD